MLATFSHFEALLQGLEAVLTLIVQNPKYTQLEGDTAPAFCVCVATQCLNEDNLRGNWQSARNLPRLKWGLARPSKTLSRLN